MTTLAQRYAEAHAELEDEIFSNNANTPTDRATAGQAMEACLPYLRAVMRLHARDHGYAASMRMVRLTALGIMAVLGCEEELLTERRKR